MIYGVGTGSRKNSNYFGKSISNANIPGASGSGQVDSAKSAKRNWSAGLRNWRIRTLRQERILSIRKASGA